MVFPVIEIFFQNENIFVEDEFLSSCVTDRTPSRVTEPTSSSLISKENSEGGISTGFVKVSAEIIRISIKIDKEKLGEECMEKAGSKKTLQRILKWETEEHKSFKENIQGKY